MNWKQKIGDILINIPGFRSKRKLLIFESDDWGSIRMSSKSAIDKLKNTGLNVEKCPYLSFDKLETCEDIEALITILSNYRDSRNRPAIFTFNTIMANPDFNKIKVHGYQEYFYEHFHKSYERYGYDMQLMKTIWSQGIDEKLIRPQFHGREHIQINRWLKSLREKWTESLLAFELEVLGISTTITKEKRASYLPAFDFDSSEELFGQKKVVEEGIKLFEKTFGFKSQSFIAPNYTWHNQLEATLMNNGVKYIQGGRAQQIPLGQGKIKVLKHRMGEKGSLGQYYTIRNVRFEPSSNLNQNWVESALNQINLAFLMGKPAVVTTHRVNYMGGISENNRKKNLELLSSLLSKLLKKYNDIEFVSSDELGAIIDKNRLIK